jgi:UDP-N-acetylmuramoyl-L-alanyl-D-glutamate--2,6-diaminopimelate ligase
LSYADAAKIRHDRRAAIAYAIENAVVGDVVLIAGKGHEPYQIIGKDRVPFSDIDEVTKILG